MTPWQYIELYGLLLVLIAVHEAGHHLAGALVGYRWKGWFVGLLQMSRETVGGRVDTEAGERRAEWLLPAPIQNTEDVNRSARRLLGQMRLPAPVVGLRLLVDDLETPVARTADLFARGSGDDPASLTAVRRALEARFGTSSIKIMSCLPRTARDERRASLGEYWQAQQQAGR